MNNSIPTSTPHVTRADVEASIASEYYIPVGSAVGTGNMKNHEEPHPTNLLTICVLVTKNGHLVTGEAYCADPAKFDAATGHKWARENAIDKLWPMVVYAERERLATIATTDK